MAQDATELQSEKHVATVLERRDTAEPLDLAKRLDYDQRRTNLKSNQTRRRPLQHAMQGRARITSNNVKSTNLI